jgi:hypothetical protein
MNPFLLLASDDELDTYVVDLENTLTHLISAEGALRKYGGWEDELFDLDPISTRVGRELRQAKEVRAARYNQDLTRIVAT